MSKRLWIALGLGAVAALLSGCVVVPDEPYGHGYGYGYGAPAPVVRVTPPPVVVTPPPRRYWWWGGGHRHGHDGRGGYRGGR
jgi:hypothetical protein